MLKPACLFCALLFVGAIFPQRRTAKAKPITPPDSVVLEWRDGIADDLPIPSSEDRQSGDAIEYLPSLLASGRDVFSSMASFHFGIARFRPRGYAADCERVLINGFPMNGLGDGKPPWAYWSGLNEVMRNTQSIMGLRSSEMDFGDGGGMSLIDMRASAQRVQTQLGYSLGNRSYRSRLSLTHSRAANKNGWMYSASGNIRYANEGRITGTGMHAAGYYLGIDKRVSPDRLFSLVFFGSMQENEKSSALTKEVVELTSDNSYNPNWGYQSGRRRSANIAANHVPVAIVSYEHRMDNHKWLLVSVGVMTGEKNLIGLDWYNAADPRPDYYRYLPAFQEDSLLRVQLTNRYRSDPALLQINWTRLYEVNRNSHEITRNVFGVEGNIVSGLRSHYIMQRRVMRVLRYGINMVYNSLPFKDISFSCGASIQTERHHFYKQLEDLLGGEYYVDLNQFAEGNNAALQNDADRPNRVLRAGDKYGYNYIMAALQLQGWLQFNMVKRKFDLFGALRIGYQNNYREGLVRTGLFPENSLGRSVLHEFPEWGMKAGLTYKLNGRRFLYLHTAVQQRAPSADAIFISPGTRDTEQEQINCPATGTMEAGYIVNAPRLKFRFSVYATKFLNEMKVLSFYHDGYRSFVNCALNDISRIHSGVEFGLDQTLTGSLSLQAVAALGRYVYSNRPDVTVSTDNDDYITERGKVYLRNYRAGASPQEAFGFGISYRRGYGFYLNFSASYFQQQWLEPNPLRRTETALAGVQQDSDVRKQLLQQESLPAQLVVDLSMGHSISLKLLSKHSANILSVYAGIGNLLNNRQLIAGGYEQLRFDSNHPGRFAPKFFYAPGLVYSLNIGLRL